MTARTARLPLLLCILAIAPHVGALRNGFVYDDHGVIVENRAVTGFDAKAIWGGPYWPNTPKAGLYRPLVSTTYAVNWAIAPGRPAPFIATNIVLHAATTLLAYWLLRRLFPGRAGVAGAASALFAVHPFHVEAIAGIVGRAELLASLFTLLAYGLWLKAEGIRSAWPKIFPAAIWLLALLSKESAIALPALLLAHRLGLLAAPSPDRKLRAADLAWPAALAIALLLRWNALGTLRNPEAVYILNPLAHLDPFRRALAAAGILARQIPQLLTLAPFACDYSFAAVKPGAALYLLGALMLPLIAAGAYLALTRGKGTVEGWGGIFFLCFWFVTSNLLLPIGTGQADRLLYLPLLGAFALGAAAVQRILPRFARSRWVTIAAGLIVLLCGSVSALRVPDWRDDMVLWTSAVRVVPESVKARMNLAMHILRGGTQDAARRALGTIEPVLSFGSTYGPLLHAEGKARMFLGEDERAIALFRGALEYGADSAKVLIEMGNIAIASGDGKNALVYFDAVRRLGDQPVHAGIGRASALSLLRRFDEAAAAWKPIADALPDSAPVRIAYAWNLVSARRPDEAARVLRAGAARRNDPRLWNALARTLLARDGREGEAVVLALQAVRLDPSPENLTTLARAQIGAGLQADAIATRARLSDPDSLRAIDRLLGERK